MIDPAESLDEYLDAQNVPKRQAEDVLFEIADDNVADWAVSKITRRLAEIEANEKLASFRKQQIDAWLATVKTDAEYDIAFFSEKLRQYLAVRLAGENAKTLKLPAGSVSLRKSAPEFSIDGEKVAADNQRLLDFVQRANPDFLKIKESVDWAALKKTLIVTEQGRVLTSDGEILDFIQAWQPPDKISVKGALK